MPVATSTFVPALFPPVTSLAMLLVKLSITPCEVVDPVAEVADCVILFITDEAPVGRRSDVNEATLLVRSETVSESSVSTVWQR